MLKTSPLAHGLQKITELLVNTEADLKSIAIRTKLACFAS